TFEGTLPPHAQLWTFEENEKLWGSDSLLVVSVPLYCMPFHVKKMLTSSYNHWVDKADYSAYNLLRRYVIRLPCLLKWYYYILIALTVKPESGMWSAHIACKMASASYGSALSQKPYTVSYIFPWDFGFTVPPQTLEGAMDLHELPADITTDILTRLPTKNVLQCRSVSKPWCSIVDDSRFAKMHLSHAIKSKTRTCSSFIVFASEDWTKTYFVEDSDELGLIISGTPKVNLMAELKAKLGGICHGLLLLINCDNSRTVYNPVTGIHVPLPDGGCIREGRCFYGLGFCVSTQEFKVLKYQRSTFKEAYSGVFESKAEVLTLDTNTWRMVGVAPYRLPSKVFYFNGSLLWLTKFNPGDYVPSLIRIASFNLDSENFEDVPNPEIIVDLNVAFIGMQYQLGELGGCLSISDGSSPDRFEVWVMQDYNVKKSWTKQYSLILNSPNVFCTCRIAGDIRTLKPLCFRKNGEILFKTTSGLVSYNAETGIITNIEVGGIRNGSRVVSTFPYMSSLILSKVEL
ncbi:hypothetical protein GIB67_043158, partial [Kingdonia uniflora]